MKESEVIAATNSTRSGEGKAGVTFTVVLRLRLVSANSCLELYIDRKSMNFEVGCHSLSHDGVCTGSIQQCSDWNALLTAMDDTESGAHGSTIDRLSSVMVRFRGNFTPG